MTITLNGTTGITTPAGTVQGDLTTTGNTVLGDASTDTLNVANGGLVKDSSGNVVVGASSITNPAGWDKGLQVYATNYPFISLKNSAKQYDISNFSNNLTFWDATSSAARMTLDSSGNLLVGTTTTGYSASNSIEIGTLGRVVVSHANGTSTGTFYMAFGYNSGGIGSITQNGTTGVLYNTSSDYRLKNITGDLTGYKERIMALQPKQGSWKSDGSVFKGFIAHEFAEQYPNAVSGEKDAVDAEGKPQYQGMQAGGSETIADLVALAKEQQAIITEQSLALQDLKARIELLEAK